MGISLKQLSRVKSFGFAQSSISVEKICIIEGPYKLLASNNILNMSYMIYELSLLVLHGFKDFSLASA